MQVLNEIKFIMPSLSVNESAARAVVSSFLIQADPTVEELSDIRTAVSEAVTNAVVHGYRGSSGKIELTVKLLPGREIYIRVKDSGCGIADVKQAMEPLFSGRSWNGLKQNIIQGLNWKRKFLLGTLQRIISLIL